jgi:AraC-like DNA-binding protein
LRTVAACCFTEAVGLDELRALVARHSAVEQTAIDGLVLSRITAPTEPAASLAEPMLVLVAQGAKRIGVGERTHDYGAGQYLVVTVDLPVTGHFTKASWDEPFLGVGLVLRPATIADLMLSSGAALPATRAPVPDAGSGLAVSSAPAELVDAMVRLLRLLDHPADQAALAPLIQREILWRLLTGEQGALVRQIGLADSTLAQVGHATRWIRDHHASPLRIDELAAQSAMSVSSFHRHFRAVTAMTPIQFQKHIRLHRARLLLMSGEQDVERVGYAIGYQSPSQFSREYRRQYGLPPGKDASRLRAVAAG